MLVELSTVSAVEVRPPCVQKMQMIYVRQCCGNSAKFRWFSFWWFLAVFSDGYNLCNTPYVKEIEYVLNIYCIAKCIPLTLVIFVEICVFITLNQYCKTASCQLWPFPSHHSRWGKGLYSSPRGRSHSQWDMQAIRTWQNDLLKASFCCTSPSTKWSPTQ